MRKNNAFEAKIVNMRLTKIFIATFAPDGRLPSFATLVINNDGADGDDDGDEDDNGDDDDNVNQGSVSQVVGARSQGRLIRLHPHCQLGQTREDAPLSSSSSSFVIIII